MIALSGPASRPGLTAGTIFLCTSAVPPGTADLRGHMTPPRLLLAVRDAADGVGKTLVVLKAGNKDDIDKAFAALATERIGVLFVTVDPLFIVNRMQIIESAVKQSPHCTFSANSSTWADS